jgi:hypothetical protein
VVWTDAKQRALLDSLDANFFIPSLVFALDEEDIGKGKKRTIRRCIDGKQRLTTIRRFMSGEVSGYTVHQTYTHTAIPDTMYDLNLSG